MFRTAFPLGWVETTFGIDFVQESLQESVPCPGRDLARVVLAMERMSRDAGSLRAGRGYVVVPILRHSADDTGCGV